MPDSGAYVLRPLDPNQFAASFNTNHEYNNRIIDPLDTVLNLMHNTKK